METFDLSRFLKRARMLHSDHNIRQMEQSHVHQMLGTLLNLLWNSPRGLHLTITSAANIVFVALDTSRRSFVVDLESTDLHPALKFDTIQQVGDFVVKQGLITRLAIGGLDGIETPLYEVRERKRGMRRGDTIYSNKMQRLNAPSGDALPAGWRVVV